MVRLLSPTGSRMDISASVMATLEAVHMDDLRESEEAKMQMLMIAGYRDTYVAFFDRREKDDLERWIIAASSKRDEVVRETQRWRRITGEFEQMITIELIAPSPV